MSTATATLLALAFSALAAALASPPAPERLLVVDRPRASTHRPGGAGPARWVIGGAAAVAWLLAPRAGLVIAASAVAVGTLVQVALSRRSDGVARRRRGEVARAARVLAGQMRVGQVPGAALRSAALDCPPLERAAAAQAIGGDVAATLRQSGREPGHQGLTELAMAWELAERAGAPIATLALQVSSSLTDDEANRAAVAAELASPRASGRLLAVLPLVGLAMGTLAGGRPVGFLMGTPAGGLCLLAGVVLAAAGVLWTEHLADAASR